MSKTQFGIFLCAAALAGADVGMAQVPRDIETGLQRIGKIVDPACTAKLYRPLMPVNDITSGAKPLYPGITIDRDVSFGPAPKDVLDIFSADTDGGALQPILVYVPGGGGNKIELQSKDANAFYDNVGRWAVKHGMVGVNMQRHQSAGWDGGAKDVAKMIAFLRDNAVHYHGDPKRIIILAHSAGNIPVGTYLGRPELWGPAGVGVKGVVFISPASFDILPLKAEMGTKQHMAKLFALAGKGCGEGGPASTDAPLPGKSAGEPGGPNPSPPAGNPSGPSSSPAVDRQVELSRSSLPELKKSSVGILLANGELDIGANPAVGNQMPFVHALHTALCAAGPAHCPPLLIAKGHSHMSIVFSFDTPDTSVSGPILAWIKILK